MGFCSGEVTCLDAAGNIGLWWFGSPCGEHTRDGAVQTSREEVSIRTFSINFPNTSDLLWMF